MIFDDTTVYNRYFVGPGGDPIWLHLGNVFLEVCQERPFCGFWMCLGCPGIPF